MPVDAEPGPDPAPEPPRSPALVCNPGAGTRVVFGMQIAGAFFAPPWMHLHGRLFLVVDDSCRFFADGEAFGEVVSGVLTDDELRDLNAELLTGPWQSITGEHREDIPGADAWTESLWRDDGGASCYASCFDSGSEASPTLREMLTTAREWRGRLRERGAASTGAVRVHLAGVATDEAPDVELQRPLDVADPYGAWVEVSWPLEDLAALRAQRGGPGESDRFVLHAGGERYYADSVVDPIPHADAAGRLRPPFSIPDRL